MKAAAAAAATERPPASVTASDAIAKDVPVYLDEIGRTAARESVTIQPQVAGKITQLHFTDGANIKKNDLLFTIDPRPYQAALAQAQATQAQAEADVKWAQSELNRFTEVQTTGAVSKNEIEQKANALAVSQARVEAAKAAVETAKLNLEYCEIRAPINGRAGQRLVDPGNVVSSGGPDGGTKMLTIQNLDPIYADFTVTENQLGTVRKFMAQGLLPAGDPQGKLKCYVDVPGDSQDVIDALGGGVVAAARATSQPAVPNMMAGNGSTTQPSKSAGPREGVLTFLDNTVANGTGTVRVRATIPNEDRYFWPGQFVKVRLVLTMMKDAVLIPSAAPQIGQQGSFVYVVKPDSTAELRPVTLGQRQGDLIVVANGVAAGEKVITAGQNMVMPGGKVAVANATTMPAQNQTVAEGPSK